MGKQGFQAVLIVERCASRDGSKVRLMASDRSTQQESVDVLVVTLDGTLTCEPRTGGRGKKNQCSGDDRRLVSATMP
jgi:hypothetical protein